MDFREYHIARDGDDVVVSGTIHEPVNWDFTIRIGRDDIAGMLRLGLNRHTLALAMRSVFAPRSSAPPAVVAPPATPRPGRPVVSPRATTASRRVAPSPSVVADPLPSHITTPDFGAPRRRGASNGESAPPVVKGDRP